MSTSLLSLLLQDWLDAGQLVLQTLHALVQRWDQYYLLELIHVPLLVALEGLIQRRCAALRMVQVKVARVCKFEQLRVNTVQKFALDRRSQARLQPQRHTLALAQMHFLIAIAPEALGMNCESCKQKKHVSFDSRPENGQRRPNDRTCMEVYD